MTQEKLRVAVFFHPAAHYRRPFLECLSTESQVDYRFYFDPDNARDSLSLLDPSGIQNFERAQFRFSRGLVWQAKAVRTALSGEFDLVVYTGDVHDVSTWIALALRRILGRPTMLWTQGWRRTETGLKAVIRNGMYRLSNGLLLYGNSARSLGAQAGFAMRNLHVIGNSVPAILDDEVRSAVLNDRGEFMEELGLNPALRTVLFSSRLKKLKRVDLLLDAAAILRDGGAPVNLIIVGDGPEFGFLHDRAEELDLDVRFVGSVFSPAALTKYYSLSDCVVVPAHAGLAVTQALQFRVPIVVDDDDSGNGPEAEAVVPGVTGYRFVAGSAESLGAALRRGTDVSALEWDEYEKIAAWWTPQNQADRFTAAVVSVGGGKRE